MLTLKELLRSIAQEAIDMAQVCAQHTQERLKGCFEEDGTPKTIKLKVDEKEIEVPTLLFVPQGSLLPDELDLELESDLVLSNEQASEPEKRFFFTLRKTKALPTGHMKIRVLLKRQDQYEATEQLRDRLNADLHNTLYDRSPSPESREEDKE